MDPASFRLGAEQALAEFTALFEAGDGRDVISLLSEDVELRPPTYGKSWRGRPLVGRLLQFASLSLRRMRYTDSWEAESHHVLRFEGEVADQKISGVDLVRLDPDGRISSIEIFARPPRAVIALRDQMATHLRQAPEVAAMMGIDFPAV